jgi:nicotinamide riboside transporter PnuC
MKKSLEQRVAAIEARNSKVEQDKAWETSWTRRISLAVLTFVVIVAYQSLINNNSPFVNGVVAAVGLLLSTLVLKSIRDIWQK